MNDGPTGIDAIDRYADVIRLHADQRPAGDEPTILDPKDPLPSARIMVEARFTLNGLRTLLHYRGSFYEWRGGAYHEVDHEAMRAAIWDFLGRSMVLSKTGNGLEPFRPNRTRVADVMEALAAVAHLDGLTEPPAWLDDAPDRPDPAECLSCANGLLHLPSGELLPQTPALFNLSASPVCYDPAAADPEAWLGFLNDIWPDDPEAIGTLQEWMGYLLTPDTSQQKIMLIVGPKRSGKGTVGRIMTRLLGQTSVANPTLDSLASNFGLESLIGRPLGIIADARLGGRADQAAIAERLLSISGEDGQTIDRKFKPAWHGPLPTRFMVLTNELPRLADASGALASRFIVLTLEQSFFGREDHHLTNRLLKELSGILRWAREGYLRLMQRGYFQQPSSSQEAVEQLEALGSPITAFVNEKCAVGPGFEVSAAALFDAWRDWCDANGRRQPGTVQTFGRDLRAAVPGLHVQRPRAEGGERERRYVGIKPIAATYPADWF